MKKIVRKTTKITFRCSICKTEYDTAGDAQKCEKRVLEAMVFARGDRVSNIEPRTCQIHDKSYIFRGEIAKIIGPMASDYEYEVKWLGAVPERIHGHVFHYQVKLKCGHCRQTREELYYAPELKKISR